MMAGMKFSSPTTWWVCGWWHAAGRGLGTSGTGCHGRTNGAAPQRNLSSSYNAAFRKRSPGTASGSARGSVGLSVLREEFGRPLTVADGGRGLVLLAACANVANLRWRAGSAAQGGCATPFPRRHARASGAPGADGEYPPGGGRRSARRLSGRWDSACWSSSCPKKPAPRSARTGHTVLLFTSGHHLRYPRCCSAWRRTALHRGGSRCRLRAAVWGKAAAPSCGAPWWWRRWPSAWCWSGWPRSSA